MPATTAQKTEVMTGETRNQAVERRMTALGMGATEMASESGLSRAQVYRVIRGESGVTDSSYTKIELTLDRLEREIGGDGPDAIMSTEAGLIEFEVTGASGVRVVVKGPIENTAEVEAAVARLVRDLRSGDGS